LISLLKGRFGKSNGQFIIWYILESRGYSLHGTDPVRHS
jgi:hypothetical protein